MTLDMIQESLSYDDVLLAPRTGVLNSRKDADASVMLKGRRGQTSVRLSVPIMSSPMESVTGLKLALAMQIEGALGVLPRLGTEYPKLLSPYAQAVGNEFRFPGSIEHANIIVYDVAHADTKRSADVVYLLSQGFPNAIIIAGSVATSEGARNMFIAGADAVRVGIGSGAACITREVTGFGVPMITSIAQCARVADEYGGQVIADGGIKSSGDIVKALCAGADAVMIGRLLAGTVEAPRPGEYFGQASEKASEHKGSHVEGVSGTVEIDKTVETVIRNLADGIRSGISYGGGSNIAEMRAKARFMKVSSASHIESGVRI